MGILNSTSTNGDKFFEYLNGTVLRDFPAPSTVVAHSQLDSAEPTNKYEKEKVSGDQEGTEWTAMYTNIM